MIEFIIVGLGGFIGCCIRFAFVKIFQPLGWQFPIATLVSNIVAGFFVGFFNGFGDGLKFLTPKTKLFLTTGMMGGLSTFSTFSMETINLFSQKKYTLAMGNVMLNLTFSLIGVVLGIILAKFIIKESI